MSDYSVHEQCFCGRGASDTSREVVEVPACVRKFAGERFTVWRCEACKSIHARGAVELERYYEDFPLHHQKLDVHLRVGFGKRLQGLLALGFNRDSSLLDYGCGSGLFLQYLREWGYGRCWGYDPFTREYGSKDVLQRRYDFVTSQDVLEHADDPNQEIILVRSVLKASGIYVVGTPRADGIDLRESSRFNVHIGQPYHRHVFSEEALCVQVARHGFEEVRGSARFYCDSFFPGANEKFILEYLAHFGGVVDTAVEKPRVLRIAASPRLLLFLFLGKLFAPGTSMTKYFRRVD